MDGLNVDSSTNSPADIADKLPNTSTIRSSPESEFSTKMIQSTTANFREILVLVEENVVGTEQDPDITKIDFDGVGVADSE